jgi:hypothetical protein
MLIRKLKQWMDSRVDFFESYIEGVYADQYKDPALRQRIQAEYQERYKQRITPLTHPWLFDPLLPPQGWRYDPYYELWLTDNQE